MSLVDQFSAAAGTRISLNSLFLRAVAMSLSRCSQVLRQYRGDTFFQPENIGLGFAVEWEDEVHVPVIHDADRKNIGEISREASLLTEKVRGGRMQPDDVSGGSITVSNLGMFGIRSFVPLLNPGEGAIIGIGAVQDACRENDGGIETFRTVEITLVCDHRSVNGATGAAFCRELTQTIETEEASSW